MTTKLIIIVGLPGSGKTTLLEKLKSNNKVSEYYDDFQGHSYDHQKDPRLSKSYTPMLARLQRGETVAVSDIRYCVSEELNKFLVAVLQVVPQVNIEFYYFENDPEACKQNVIKRGRAENVDLELKLIDEFSANYSIPAINNLKVHTN